MSLPARMMAIADIFEALTAADRPYKKAKPLSESLAIMARMRDEAHIDPDIFRSVPLGRGLQGLCRALPQARADRRGQSRALPAERLEELV